MKNAYEEILHHPHHVSKTRPQMPMSDRAAQFSPFSALTGYDAAIRETGRLTEERLELGESQRDALDAKQQFLNGIIAERPTITVTYFVPDARKKGGAYAIVTGKLKRMEEAERLLVLTDGRKIPMDEITDIACDRFVDLGEETI